MIGIPAIDLRGGKVIRLVHGDPNEQTTYGDDPVAMAERFAAAGAKMIHVVDLDAALGDGHNREVVRAICAAVDVPVQTGGGLRDLAAVSAVLEAGAARAVLGSMALDRELWPKALDAFGDSLVVALDVEGRAVRVKGWTEDAGDLGAQLIGLDDAPRIMLTQINVDGTMKGPDIDLYREMLVAVKCPVIASGGVRNAADLGALAAVEVDGRRIEGAIVGKAIYEGTITLEEVCGP